MSAPCPDYGFVLHATVDAGVSRETIDTLVSDLSNLLEANGMAMGRAGDRTLEFVINREGAQATHADRKLVVEWTERWEQVGRFIVSDVIDLGELAE